MAARAFGERSDELAAALESASDPRDVTLNLPDSVEGGVEFTVVARDLGEGNQAWDVAIDWDGESAFAPFWFDISGHEGISPGSSAPVHGWASWQADGSIVIAFADSELGSHGTAWGDGVVMIDEETSETTTAPLKWAKFAQFAIDRVIGALMGDDENARVFGGDRGAEP